MKTGHGWEDIWCFCFINLVEKEKKIQSNFEVPHYFYCRILVFILDSSSAVNIIDLQENCLFTPGG